MDPPSYPSSSSDMFHQNPTIGSQDYRQQQPHQQHPHQQQLVYSQMMHSQQHRHLKPPSPPDYPPNYLPHHHHTSRHGSCNNDTAISSFHIDSKDYNHSFSNVRTEISSSIQSASPISLSGSERYGAASSFPPPHSTSTYSCQWSAGDQILHSQSSSTSSTGFIEDSQTPPNHIYQPSTESHCQSLPHSQLNSYHRHHSQLYQSPRAGPGRKSGSSTSSSGVRGSTSLSSPVSPMGKQVWCSVGRRTRRKEDKVCGICGDKALSFNFDAVSCESCKAFFRRNASKGVKTFKCSYDERCVITPVSRRFCKRCRLRTCFEIGMKKEYILSYDERLKKRQQIDQNKLIRKLEERGWLSPELLPAEIASRNLLTDSEIEMIDELEKAYQASVHIVVESRVGDRKQPSFVDLINLAEISVRRVIEMAKKIPSFSQLKQTDQIALLKGGAIELLILRGVISYNPTTNQFLEGNDNAEGNAMSMTDLVCGAGGEAGTGFMELARSLMADLQCNHTMLLLLLIVCLFSNRPSLDEASRPGVEDAQLRYTLLLEKLLQTIFPIDRARHIFPLLIGKLTDLRELNQVFGKQAAQLSGNAEMIPLMNELLKTTGDESTDTAAASFTPPESTTETTTKEAEQKSEIADPMRDKNGYQPLSPTSPTAEQLCLQVKAEPTSYDFC